MKKNYLLLMFYAGILSVTLPAIVYAAGLQSFRDIVNKIILFINGQIMPMLIILAIIFFFWNIVHFLMKMDNETERQKFKKYSINSLIGIFIILSVWGIVGLGTGIFFNTTPGIPQLPVK